MFGVEGLGFRVQEFQGVKNMGYCVVLRLSCFFACVFAVGWDCFCEGLCLIFQGFKFRQGNNT